MRTKIMPLDLSLEGVTDGMTIMVGGFGLIGSPLGLLEALLTKGCRDLTVISNNLGEPGKGLGALVLAGRVRKFIGSFATSNPDAVRLYQAGELEVDLRPQGTLAEAIRAGGAGIPAFFTPTAAGTLLAQGREVREFSGRPHILEPALVADVALIRAHRADELGNLTYRKTARNFNPAMATAAKLVIAEVDEVVPTGELDPELIVTPHLYVDRIVLRGKSA